MPLSDILLAILLGFFLICVFIDNLSTSKVIAIFVCSFLALEFLNYFLRFLLNSPVILGIIFVIMYIAGIFIKHTDDNSSNKREMTFLDKVSKNLDESARKEKQRERERMVEEIEDLKRERDSIPTYNGILMGGSGISEEKLQHNRYKRDKLEELIQDKERELYYFDLENRN